MKRPLARAATPLAALAAVLALAVPAAAHVEVKSTPAQALAVDAVVAFDAEGENPGSGITEVKVTLPAGIAPGDVTLAEGPKGWTLKPTADGFAVSGPALGASKDAAYKVKVRQLPDAKELAFKSVVTYADGKVDRWIELPQGAAKPAHPAPVLKLSAAAPGATPLAAATTAAAPSSAAAAAPAPVQPSAPASAAAEASAPVAQSGGSSVGGAVTIGLVVALVVLVGGVVWWRRRTPES
ncbi:DUF1775 domain-containing protein [Kitasatospora camelliae]|uniref:DUF1775 domain-containing protein n=1 Tax=Kitasatospora camelliae TaxID=3156397 RepID=A0AAU8JUI8_9ACTN